MNDDFIAWLCDMAALAECIKPHPCKYCPFYDKETKAGCAELTADQKREILMQIYESEVNTDASNN